VDYSGRIKKFRRAQADLPESQLIRSLPVGLDLEAAMVRRVNSYTV
jgi:hypothetical protein